MSETSRCSLFISYNRKDAEWLEQLKTHLTPLGRHGIEVWDDSKIEPGSQWKEELDSALKRATAALLLLTPNYLASDFIPPNELAPILESARQRGMKIFWLPVRHAKYDCIPGLTDYQALLDPSRPLSAMQRDEADAALVRVVDKIVAALTSKVSETNKSNHAQDGISIPRTPRQWIRLAVPLLGVGLLIAVLLAGRSCTENTTSRALRDGSIWRTDAALTPPTAMQPATAPIAPASVRDLSGPLLVQDRSISGPDAATGPSFDAASSAAGSLPILPDLGVAHDLLAKVVANPCACSGDRWLSGLKVPSSPAKGDIVTAIYTAAQKINLKQLQWSKSELSWITDDDDVVLLNTQTGDIKVLSRCPICSLDQVHERLEPPIWLIGDLLNTSKNRREDTRKLFDLMCRNRIVYGQSRNSYSRAEIRQFQPGSPWRSTPPGSLVSIPAGTEHAGIVNCSFGRDNVEFNIIVQTQKHDFNVPIDPLTGRAFSAQELDELGQQEAFGFTINARYYDANNWGIWLEAAGQNPQSAITVSIGGGRQHSDTAGVIDLLLREVPLRWQKPPA